jgi:hypothetical protein
MRGVGFPLQWAVRRDAPRDVVEAIVAAYPMAARRIPPGGTHVVDVVDGRRQAARYAAEAKVFEREEQRRALEQKLKADRKGRVATAVRQGIARATVRTAAMAAAATTAAPSPLTSFGGAPSLASTPSLASSPSLASTRSLATPSMTFPVATLVRTQNFGTALIFPSTGTDDTLALPPGCRGGADDTALENVLHDMCSAAPSPTMHKATQNIDVITSLDAPRTGLRLTTTAGSPGAQSPDRLNPFARLPGAHSPSPRRSARSRSRRRLRHKNKPFTKSPVSLCAALGIPQQLRRQQQQQQLELQHHHHQQQQQEQQRRRIHLNPLDNTFRHRRIGARWLSWLNLRCVNLQGCHLVTDYGVACLASAMSATLESLSLAEIPRLSDQGLVALRDKCRRLSSLDLRGAGRGDRHNHNLIHQNNAPRITGNGCAWTLVQGRLSHVMLGDIGSIDDEVVLGSVRKCCDVGMADRGEPTVLYDAVPAMSPHAPDYHVLRTLDLSKCSLTDTALQYLPLTVVASVTSLNLAGPGNDLSDAGVGRLLDCVACTKVDDSTITPRPLVNLNLSYLPGVTTAVVPRLVHGYRKRRKSLQYLEALDIRGTRIQVEVLLRYLAPADGKCTRSSSKAVAAAAAHAMLRAPELRCLGIDAPARSARTVGHLVSQFRRLHTLRIGRGRGLHALVETLTDAQRRQFVKNKFTFTRPRWAEHATSHDDNSSSTTTTTTNNNHNNNTVLNALPVPKIRATTSSTPTGCREHRGAPVALNGDMSGIYGTTIVDAEATTTITDMERAAWWEVDLGRAERIGWVKIVLPDPGHGKSRPECLRMQFPFWVFLYGEDYAAKRRRACRETGGSADTSVLCPSRILLAPSVWSERVAWKEEEEEDEEEEEEEEEEEKKGGKKKKKKQEQEQDEEDWGEGQDGLANWRTERSIWCKVPTSIEKAVRYIRIQHESGGDTAYPEGKPLSLAEVSVLPLRLERVEIAGVDAGIVSSGRSDVGVGGEESEQEDERRARASDLDVTLRRLWRANPHLRAGLGRGGK